MSSFLQLVKWFWWCSNSSGIQYLSEMGGTFFFHYLKNQKHKFKAPTMNFQFLLILSGPLDKRWQWQKVNFVFFFFPASFLNCLNSSSAVHCHELETSPVTATENNCNSYTESSRCCSCLLEPTSLWTFSICGDRTSSAKTRSNWFTIQNDRGLLKCTLPMFIGQQQPAVYPTNLKFIGCDCEALWSLPQCVTEDTAFFKKNMHLHLHHVGTESLMVL